jgi:ER lumen protein retaining receptor
MLYGMLIGDLLHLLSIFILLGKMLTQRSCAGLSLKTQMLYALVFSTRYLDLLPSFHTHPIHHAAIKLFFLFTSFHIVFLMRYRFKTSYDKKNDTFRIRYLIVPCILIAIPFHPSRFNPRWLLWAFSVWLESVAILPQLFLLQRTGGAETLTSHYLFALGGYRFCYTAQWIYDVFTGGEVYWVLWVAGILQSVLYADFFYHYFTKVVHGKQLKLPN